MRNHELLEINEDCENDFNESYLQNFIDKNKITFLYVYNQDLQNQIAYVINKNIETVQNTYNPDITLKIKVSKLMHQTLNKILDKEVSLPIIMVFKDQELVEFLDDCILIEK